MQFAEKYEMRISFIQLTVPDYNTESSSRTNLHDLVDKCRQIRAFKSLLQAGHFIQNTSQCPDIRLVIVWLTFALPAKYSS